MQIHLLDLVNTMMREGNDAGFAVGGFTEEVAGTFAHDEGRLLGGGGGGGASDLEWCAGKGGRRGNYHG